MKNLLIPVAILMLAACNKAEETADPYMKGFEEHKKACEKVGMNCDDKDAYRRSKMRQANESCRLSNRINNTNVDCNAKYPFPSEKDYQK